MNDRGEKRTCKKNSWRIPQLVAVGAQFIWARRTLIKHVRSCSMYQLRMLSDGRSALYATALLTATAMPVVMADAQPLGATIARSQTSRPTGGKSQTELLPLAGIGFAAFLLVGGSAIAARRTPIDGEDEEGLILQPFASDEPLVMPATPQASNEASYTD
jgi:hypothetical protein